jgi:hypothetical protein
MDKPIAIECAKCHALNFVPLSASSKEYVCVSCGAPLIAPEPAANNRPPAQDGD